MWWRRSEDDETHSAAVIIIELDMEKTHAFTSLLKAKVLVLW